MTTPPDPPALPPRPPRPLLVHALIDTAVAFLALVVVLLVLGTSVWVVLVLAVVLGIATAPLTRRAEERALFRRNPPPSGLATDHTGHNG